jgi:FixJ family two-component response regulator
MGRGRKPLAVEIEEQDRMRLEEWARRPKTAQALALRARIVLRAAEGGDSTRIARELGVHPDTTRKWRQRFVAP